MRHLLLLLLLAACTDTTAPDTDTGGGDGDTDSDSDTDTDTDSDSDTDTDSDSDSDSDTDTDSDSDTDTGSAGQTLVLPFDDPTEVDPASTARIATGRAIGDPPFPLLDPGDGADGELALGPGAHEVHAGDASFTRLALSGATLQVDGDATLRVNGPLELSAEGHLQATGAHTLVVSGPITLDCAYLTAVGDLVIHHTGTDPVVIGCAGGVNAFVGAEGVDSATPSDLFLFTRGALALGPAGYVVTDANGGGGAVGNVVVRAYGEVALTEQSFLRAANAVGPGGRVEVHTEAGLSVSDSEISSGVALASGAGEVVVRAGGDVTLAVGATLSAGNGAGLDVETEGALRIEGASHARALPGGSVRLVAAGVTVDGAFVYVSETEGPGGAVAFDVLGDLLVTNGASVEAGPAVCADGGALTARVTGDVTVSNGGRLRGGDSYDGFTTDTCSAQEGGPLSVTYGGALTDDAGVVEPGDGNFPGALDLVQAPVSVAPRLDRLTRSVVVGLPIAATGTLTAVELGPTTGLVAVEVGDGTTWTEPSTGAPLPSPFLWRALLDARWFDAATLDALTLAWE